MKKIIILIALLAVKNAFIAQVLNNSKSGESALIYPGGAVSFDLNTTTLGFGYNYYGDSSAFRSGFMGGFNVQAKNNESISNLFNRGDFTPEGKGKIILGYSWVWGTSKAGKESERLVNELRTSDSLFIFQLKKNADSILNITIPDRPKYLTAKNEIVDKINKVSYKSLYKIMDLLSLKEPSISSALTEIKIFIQEQLKEHENVMQEKNKAVTEIHNSIANSNNWSYRLSLFAEGGVGALEFKRYAFADSANYSNNFKDQSFRGGDSKIGLNLQIGGTLLLGIAGGYKKTNNFELLTGKEYVIRNSASNATQQQITEKKITAYTGTYGMYDQTYLLFDVVYFRKLDSKTIVALNPYFKTRFSSDKTVYPDVKDIGLNAFFFKRNGKFSGGVYVELSDIDNNLEKMKDEPNLRKPENRLDFGIVVKFNIGSLPSYNN